MGQGISTGHSSLLCEAMDYPLEQLVVKNAPSNRIYDNRQFQFQSTGGSTSTSSEWKFILNIGASIRAAILEAASKKLNALPGDLKTEDGFVIYQGKKHAYQSFSGELLKTNIREVEFDHSKLKNAKYVGKKVKRVDGFKKMSGLETYGIDTKDTELTEIVDPLVAVIIPPPVLGAVPVSCNEQEVLSSDGVKHVVKLEEGFAVVASTYWQATKARQLADVKWENPKERFDTRKYAKDCLALVNKNEGGDTDNDGDDYEKLDHEIEATYVVPYLAHAPLEPQNCTVDVKADSIKVWFSTQGPGGIKPALSELTGIDHDKIHVNVSAVGGGFGRKSVDDSVIKATKISMKIKKPVKLMLSREDDMQAGYYRPHVTTKLSASMSKDGKKILYKQSVATQSIMSDALPNMIPGMLPSWVGNRVSKGLANLALKFGDGATLKEGIIPPYGYNGTSVTWHQTRPPVKTHFWRAVGHTQNGYFVECFTDEIAEKLGEDPLEFRRKRLLENQRLLRVLNKAADMANYTAGDSRHLGIAAHDSFKSSAAAIIEVEGDGDSIKVKNVWAVLDCGKALNPDAVHAQISGSVVFGLTAAMYGKLDIHDGKVIQENFHNYPLLSLGNCPDIKTEIVESLDEPTGVGEPVVPVVAPALVNAVFSLTGKRVRSLPLSDQFQV